MSRNRTRSVDSLNQAGKKAGKTASGGSSESRASSKKREVSAHSKGGMNDKDIGGEPKATVKKRKTDAKCRKTTSTAKLATGPTEYSPASENEFFSCLTAESSWNSSEQSSPGAADGDNLRIDSNLMLKRCLSIQEVDDESWLSSSLIDLVISTFAKRYEDVYFLPIDFVVMALTSSDKELKNVTDITGTKVDFRTKKPIVFVSSLQVFACKFNSCRFPLIAVYFTIISTFVPYLSLNFPVDL